MLGYEIKKSFLNMSILFFLVVCSFLEIYKINEFSRLNTPYDNKFGGFAYSDTFKKYGGQITPEKAEYVINFTLSARQLIQSGGYDEESDTAEYVTGNLYTDYSLFSIGFYTPMKYSYEYKDYAEGIAQKALDNIEFFNARGNDYEAAVNQQIYQLYSGRYLSEIYRNDGYENFFKYEFTCIPVCFMLIVGLAPLFVGEKAAGMCNLLRSCSKGGKSVFLSKLTAGFIYTFFVFAWFTCLDLICFECLYGFHGGEAPIYSIQALKNVPLNCSLFVFLIITLSLRFIGYLAFSSIIMTVSVCISHTAVCGGVSAMVIALLLFADNLGIKFVARISPLRIIISLKLYEKYSAINIFGVPIPIYWVLAVGNILVCAVLSAICGFVWTNSGKKYIKATPHN